MEEWLYKSTLLIFLVTWIPMVFYVTSGPTSSMSDFRKFRPKRKRK